ncbi:MAG: hypothetical protein ACR2QW_09330 [bacterium]
MEYSQIQTSEAAPRLADQADKHLVYQQMVQSPEADIELLQSIYQASRGCKASHLREDFCGTGFTLACWIAQGDSYSGEGFDIDPEPVAWGWQNNFTVLGNAASRATLHLEDVRAPSQSPPDIRCAFNFSYWIFSERSEMLGYFKAAHQDLADHGLFIIDVTGGTESLDEDPFESEVGEITCIWQQQNYSPVDHTAELTLRFRFADGSEIEPPYQYRWRVWSIPELKDLLMEAGFRHTAVWWQDDEREGNGYHTTDRGHNEPCWVACIAALK